MATKKSGNSTAVGISIAAAVTAAAAAGAYWFYGSADAPKHRKQVKSWMLKARAEVLEAVEKLGEIDKKTYLSIVDQVAKRYSGAAGATTAEVAQMTRDLKSAWQHIHAAKTAGNATPKKAAKKSAKKAVSRKSK